MKTVAECSQSIWNTISSHVNKAVVFADNISAEILHWNGGLVRLLNAGAISVKEFSSFECAKPDQKKAVFIISSLLVGVTKDILRDIIQASSFQYVVVITSLGSAVHNYYLNDTAEELYEFFEQVEDRLLEWMGNMNYTAEVFHVPLFTISIDNSVFLTPGYHELFPLLQSDLGQVERLYNSKKPSNEGKDFSSLKSLDFVSLPQQLQVMYKNFVSMLDSLLYSLEVKEDIFSLGCTSGILASELESYPLARNRRKTSFAVWKWIKEDIFSLGCTSGILASELESYPPARNRRKTMTDRASILLIDRTLDSAAATSHSFDALLDQIINVLPRLPGHVIDVAIDMSSLCKVQSPAPSNVIAPGCLATQSDINSSTHLHNLIFSKQKEGLMDVNRHLIEAASQCDLPVSLKGRPTRVNADQLESTLQLFKGKYQHIEPNLDALQVAMATSRCLRSSSHHHGDNLISVEKSLIQSLADPDGPGPLEQIVQIVNKKSEDGKQLYSLDDILSLLVFLYSLAGKDIIEDDEGESNLQTSLVDRIMLEKEELPPLIKSIVGDAVVDRSIVSDIIEDMFEKLAALATVRDNLQFFQNIYNQGSAVAPASQCPLVKQVMECIFDPDKGPLPIDIEYKSGGLKDMLKSGFGLFRSVSKPRPNDHPLLIVFIVGGMTATEIKQIQDTVSSYKPKTQVIVGSTRLLSVSDIVRSVLCANNVNPGH